MSEQQGTQETDVATIIMTDTQAIIDATQDTTQTGGDHAVRRLGGSLGQIKPTLERPSAAEIDALIRLDNDSEQEEEEEQILYTTLLENQKSPVCRTQHFLLPAEQVHLLPQAAAEVA